MLAAFITGDCTETRSVMDPAGVLHRLERATNDHDLEALVECFAEDYRNETPAHPARGFHGREQVRSNYRQLFAGIPDLRARVLRSTEDGAVVWSEWEMSGTRRDGADHLMRGVVIFEVSEERATCARFYLEPVDRGDGDADAAVREVAGMTS
jgi:limonene-1,2-epoxide hydrolase